MSEKQNYDKILLTSGIVLGLGVATWGVITLVGLDKVHKFSTKVTTQEVETPAGIAEAKNLNAVLTEDHTLKPIPLRGEGNVLLQEYVGFASPSLWIKLGDTEPFDIIAGKPIHGNIPNKWFIDNRLEKEFVYDDVLTRDPDGDGFTVLEEFEAGTHPNDPANHPTLTDKLNITDDGIKQSGFYLVFSQADGDNFSFKAVTRSGQEIWKDTVTPNTEFGVRKGSKDPKRFQLVSVEKKEFKDPKLDMVEEAMVATVKDLKATKNGQTYTVRQGSKHQIAITDRKVIFTITAGSASGETVEVEEGADFLIPGTKTPVYTVKVIDNKSQTATIADKKTGTQKTITKKNSIKF